MKTQKVKTFILIGCITIYLDLSKTITILKENVSSRLSLMDGNIKDLDVKIINT